MAHLEAFLKIDTNGKCTRKINLSISVNNRASRRPGSPGAMRSAQSDPVEPSRRGTGCCTCLFATLGGLLLIVLGPGRAGMQGVDKQRWNVRNRPPVSAPSLLVPPSKHIAKNSSFRIWHYNVFNAHISDHNLILWLAAVGHGPRVQLQVVGGQ